jgi:hypothetical protein
VPKHGGGEKVAAPIHHGKRGGSRKKKRAGLPVAPYLPIIAMDLLSDREWSEAENILRTEGLCDDAKHMLRNKFNHLLSYYLSFVVGEANAPSEREVSASLCAHKQKISASRSVVYHVMKAPAIASHRAKLSCGV